MLSIPIFKNSQLSAIFYLCKQLIFDLSIYSLALRVFLFKNQHRHLQTQNQPFYIATNSCNQKLESWLILMSCYRDYQTNQYKYQIKISPSMVQIQKADKKAVYRYLLNEGVIVVHKDFSNAPHKGTNVPNIQVWMLMRSLKDRGFVELVFSWQYFYYFLNQEGKKYLAEFMGLTEEVVPLTWKKDEKRNYEHFDDQGKVRRVRRDRDNAPGAANRGGRGGQRRPPRGDAPTETKPAETPAE